MTVREAFSLAYGDVPEGATCHFAHDGFTGGWGVYFAVCYRPCGTSLRFLGGQWQVLPFKSIKSPDISDRPAEAFLGFFGEVYDKVVQGG